MPMDYHGGSTIDTVGAAWEHGDMVLLFRMVRRWFERAVPSRYTGRRDRLSDAADQLTNANQFRGGQ